MLFLPNTPRKKKKKKNAMDQQTKINDSMYAHTTQNVSTSHQSPMVVSLTYMYEKVRVRNCILSDRRPCFERLPFWDVPQLVFFVLTMARGWQQSVCCHLFSLSFSIHCIALQHFHTLTITHSLSRVHHDCRCLGK